MKSVSAGVALMLGGFLATIVAAEGNSHQTALILALGESAGGIIHFDENREDWYAVTIPFDGALEVVVEPGSALDTYIGLFDEDGETALNFHGGAYSNQGGFGEPDTAMRPDLKAGLYYIRVSLWSSGGHGAYTVTASFTPTEFPEDRDQEPNDTWEQAQSIIIDTTYRGQLGYHKNDTTDIHDWYAVTLPFDGALQVVVEPGSALDTYVGLFDEDGETALNFHGGAYSNQGGLGEPDTAMRPDLQAGLYYIRVSTWIGAGYGSYELSTVFTPTEFPQERDQEPNDTWEQAQTLDANSSSIGQLGYYKNGLTDRYDWYVVTLSTDGALEAVVEPGSALNTYIGLFDEDGETALNFHGGAYSNQGGHGEPDTVRAESLKAGTYYLRIGAFGTGQGSYRLTVTTLDAPEAAFEADIRSGQAPLKVRFTDKSSGSVSQWNWDFGDGNESTERNPVHTYSAEGDYTVRLVVSDGMSSDTVVSTGYITVETLPAMSDTWGVISTGVSENLVFVHQVDSLTVVALSRSATAVISRDRGATWTEAGAIPGSPGIRKGYMDGAGRIWAVGESGGIYTSSDTAASWKTRSAGVSRHLLRTFFVDRDNGWIVGDGGVVLKTTNGGTTWSTATTPEASHISDVLFFNSDTGVVLAHYGKIFTTFDAGKKWTARVDYNFTFDYRGWAGLARRSAGELVAVCRARGDVYLSSDGAVSWEKHSRCGIEPPILGVGRRGSILFTWGNEGQVQYLPAGASKWEADDMETEYAIYDMSLEGPDIFACGENGLIFRKTAPAPVALAMKPVAHAKNEQFRFDSHRLNAHISVSLPVPQEVIVELHNLEGRLVRVQRYAMTGPGERTLRWSAAGVASGHYILTVRTHRVLQRHSLGIEQ